MLGFNKDKKLRKLRLCDVKGFKVGDTVLMLHYCEDEDKIKGFAYQVIEYNTVTKRFDVHNYIDMYTTIDELIEDKETIEEVYYSEDDLKITL